MVPSGQRQDDPPFGSQRPIEDLDDFSSEKTKATTEYPIDYADAA